MERPDRCQRIRSTHPCGFRRGEWAWLRGVVPGPDRSCYLVEFEDGVTDFWAVVDASDHYEFWEERDA